MKRVLVSGASGFIGRESIVKLLERGYEVHALYRRDPPDHPQVRWYRADLADGSMVRDVIGRVAPTHLLHLAWYAVPGLYWTSSENLQSVANSLQLIRAFAEGGGRRCVVAGTCAEYAWRGHDGVCREDVTPLAPEALYGSCKNALREMLDAYAPLFGLSHAWGRIFSLYGPYEQSSRLVPSAVTSLLNGQVARFGDGNLVRDYLHVGDVAAAFVAVLDSDLEGAINIGSGRGVRIADILTEIGGIIGRRELLNIGARPIQEREPAFLVADVARLHGLGWEPHFSLESGLRQTVDWWRTRMVSPPGTDHVGAGV